MGHLVSSSQLSLPHHSYPHVLVTWNVKAGHLALKASQVLRVAGTLLNGVQFPVVLEQQGVSISPGIILTDTLSTHWHTLVWRVTARVCHLLRLSPLQGMFTCGNFIKHAHNSLHPGIQARLQHDFAVSLRHEVCSPPLEPWLVLGLAFNQRMWQWWQVCCGSLNKLRSICWVMPYCLLHLRQLLPTPRSRPAQLMAADTQGAPGAQPPLPTVGVWTSGWFVTKQRLTDTEGSVCSRCAGICLLCCLQTKNLITYYFKRMKYELENEKLFLWKPNVL